jgi:hypothetical protein
MTEKTAKPMDVDLITRGCRIISIGRAAIDRLVNRDMESIGNQLVELYRSIEHGEPTEFVRQFGWAHEIANSADAPSCADNLANSVLYDDAHRANTLELSTRPLMCLACGIEDGDGLKAMIRLWCHGGAIELGEDVEREMFKAVGLEYTPYKGPYRKLADVPAEDDDEDEDAA